MRESGGRCIDVFHWMLMCDAYISESFKWNHMKHSVSFFMQLPIKVCHLKCHSSQLQYVLIYSLTPKALKSHLNIMKRHKKRTFWANKSWKLLKRSTGRDYWMLIRRGAGFVLHPKEETSLQNSNNLQRLWKPSTLGLGYFFICLLYN